jgi:ferredoxin
MNVVIAYFSGTGNTGAIAQGYRRVLASMGHRVEVFSIEEASSLPDHDVLIVGGPIYAGNMPDELIVWIRRNVRTIQADSSAKMAMVYSTSAGLLNAHGVKSIGMKLIKKGYRLVDTPTFEMPRNFYIDKYDPTPEDVQKKQFEEAAVRIVESVRTLDTNGEKNIAGSVLMIDLLADVFRIMAKSLGKKFHITERCIGCGLCERNCPKKNIDHRKKEYSNRCMMCTRCIHNCPVNAIAYKGKHIDPYRVHHDIMV